MRAESAVLMRWIGWNELCADVSSGTTVRKDKKQTGDYGAGWTRAVGKTDERQTPEPHELQYYGGCIDTNIDIHKSYR